VKRWRKSHGLTNQTQVFEEAPKLIMNRDLESAYREAAEEDETINLVWDIATSDGLPDDAW
jgi:hypothetical protein